MFTFGSFWNETIHQVSICEGFWKLDGDGEDSQAGLMERL